MDDELILKILHGQCDLPEVVAGLYLSDSFPPFDEFVHGLIEGGGTWLVQSSRMM